MNAETIAAAQAAALKYKVPVATILGVTEQESAGVVFAPVDGHNEPVVRHEGHYLYKRLTGAKRDDAVRRGLASPKVGGVKNPASQQARWDKLLKPAMAIDRSAEIESVSWGVGQVMGAHWEKLGFQSAQELMDHTRKGVDGQVDLMMRYCKNFGLIDELQRGDFVGFTRGYNGTGNVASYSSSMKKKVEKWAKKFPAGASIGVAQGTVDNVPVVSPKRTQNAETMLRMGVTGAKVRELQMLLVRAGYAVTVDGDFGPATKNAVIEFQRANGLEDDGIAGPATLKALEQFKVAPDEQPGAVSATEAVTNTDEGKTGGIAAGGGIGIITAKEGIQQATDSLYGSVGTGGVIDKIYIVLTIAGAVLTIAGLAYVAYGWWKANNKTEGVKEA